MREMKKKLLMVRDYRDSGVIISFVILRFIATCLITNSHYDNVYPTHVIAVGGLLGNVLFFVVSGFGLARPTKQGFLLWYAKRIIRIYPTIIFGVAFYLLVGYQGIENFNVFQVFVFPTFFAFTAAISILYIPFYFVNKIENKKTYINTVILFLIIWLLVYFFVLDKSTYEMSNTKNPMIGFLYFFSMMIGGYIRRFAIKKCGKIQMLLCMTVSCLFMVMYFFLTKIIRGNERFFSIQITVQIALIISVFFGVLMIYHMEGWLKKLPDWVLFAINFISAFTLEIYVIQNPIINFLCDIIFPINWILITATIFIGAVFTHVFINFTITSILMFTKKIKEAMLNKI